jgi:hypothetical protein
MWSKEESLFGQLHRSLTVPGGHLLTDTQSTCTGSPFIQLIQIHSQVKGGENVSKRSIDQSGIIACPLRSTSSSDPASQVTGAETYLILCFVSFDRNVTPPPAPNTLWHFVIYSYS